MKVEIKQRKRCEKTFKEAIKIGLAPIIANIVSSRISNTTGDLEKLIYPSLKYLQNPALLKDSNLAADRIIKSIVNNEKIGILSDYDVDGLCAHVVIYDALTKYFGFNPALIDSFIGHRINDGYGVSNGLTDKILNNKLLPKLIITADCGSSDEERIKRLSDAGIDVVVTDHHAIEKEKIPNSAYATVNPQRHDCDYPDKVIAGCMVSWLLMCHVRNRLIDITHISSKTPKLLGLLDCVGLATVADHVSLTSFTNRAIIKKGFALINNFNRPCWKAMHNLLNKKRKLFSITDLSFQISPRINARSRMDDPYAALKYILTDSEKVSKMCLSVLDINNRQRKEVEKDMVTIAKKQVSQVINNKTVSIVAYDPSFHVGVCGIVASRLVEMYGRPSVVLCIDTKEKSKELLVGSARTIESINIYNCLKYIDENYKDIIYRFGGHHGAAGLTIYLNSLYEFKKAFSDAVLDQAGENINLTPIYLIDGTLRPADISINTLNKIQNLEPFGKEFESPVFEGDFFVKTLRTVGLDAIHLSMQLLNEDKTYLAIWFRAIQEKDDPLPFDVDDKIKCLYTLNLNEYRNIKTLQLIVKHAFKI